MTVANTEDRSSLFYLPMSVQAYSELCVLDTDLKDGPLSGDKDVWFYR
jgi:hypothetical protein